MKLRIAVIAACAGTLALAQADVAHAQTDNTAKKPSTAKGGEPGIVIAIPWNKGGDTKTKTAPKPTQGKTEAVWSVGSRTIPR
jgi:hypothetical protein